eukprot:Gregarina_sp_Pseudo_9__1987@NODE_2377_length_1019_cov_1149_327551_g2189_i0_p1_GENE_NODE_2377_length_1019_cov_1149_327551_g2189_i0NODE_2377_length_1019_cov_1149_327551_g2189_i0_p1_ORF_typecomplete_len220_score38_90_NODE_2377_length_1019_cov_1149_327551_g2189_i0223882
MRPSAYTGTFPVSSSTTSYTGAPHVNTTTSTTRYATQMGSIPNVASTGMSYQTGNSYQAGTSYTPGTTYQTGGVSSYPAASYANYQGTSYPSGAYTSSYPSGAYTSTTTHTTTNPGYSYPSSQGYGNVYAGTSTAPYPTPVYSTSTGNGSTVQYTSEASQKYTPPGCQAVNAFPHGISTIYSTGLVPAFMAAPDVKIPTGSFVGWGLSSVPEATNVIRH